ncbi:hypothetical protein [Fulvivirga kasyanovii]|uniref:hypothetical protein n=1 Tax=Fulvivirga kasyanovii TaxID=396812 RepID=UPI0031DC0361
MTVLQAIGNNFPILIPDEQIKPIDHGKCYEVHGVLIPNSILSSHVSKIALKN